MKISTLAPLRRPARRSMHSLLLVACTTLLAPVGLSVSSTGCLLGACNEAGCSSGFDVSIDGGLDMDDRLAAGTYVILAEADDGLFEVECTIDDMGVGSCNGGDWVMEPSTNLDVHVSAWAADEVDPSRGDAIHLSFHASSEARHGVNQFGPDVVDLTVERDGMEVASESFVPQYEITEDFNGKGCGDCEFALPERLEAGS